MVNVKTEDYFADLSTNAMGVETRIQELLSLNSNGVKIDGILCKNEEELRDYLRKKGILDEEQQEKVL